MEGRGEGENTMTRKSPIRHKVRKHIRKGNQIQSYQRGSGKKVKRTRSRAVGSQRPSVMKYELEKTRYRYGPGEDWEYTTIAESDNMQELVDKAKKVKIRFGKTFHEQLHINCWDEEHIDIIEVIGLRDALEEHMEKTGKKWYEV